jgi:hypothetical protein
METKENVFSTIFKKVKSIFVNKQEPTQTQNDNKKKTPAGYGWNPIAGEKLAKHNKMKNTRHHGNGRD